MTKNNCFVAKNKMKKNCSYVKVNFCSLLKCLYFHICLKLLFLVKSLEMRWRSG